MDCITVQTVKFRKRLSFKQYNVIMTQEQSVLTKLDRYFNTEDKIFQHYVLGCRTDMYVPKYKLAIEVDELGYCTRDIKAEIKRQQKIEKELICKIIRIDPSREHFNIIGEYSRIRDYMIESTNKATKKATKNKKQEKRQLMKFQIDY